MRTHDGDGLTITSHLRLIRRSLLESWPVSAEEKAKAVEFVASVIENANGECSAKQILSATRILMMMNQSNIQNMLQAEMNDFSTRRFSVMHGLEKLRERCLADEVL